MERVFITGMAGFIGFHLARHLEQKGVAVTGYDNFNDYYDPSLKRLREKELNSPIVEGDLCDRTRLENAIASFNPTHIVHLAAQAGVRYSLENPAAYIASNIEGFCNILEICRANPTVPLIYASSSSVYGLNVKTPFSEIDKTDHPASLYGATKKSNELMAHAYHHLFGLRVTGLRFFTVYGPWGRPDMAYYSFTEKILQGEPIDLFNGGKMERDFTYIDDIVSGIEGAINYSAPCEVFNLGNNGPEPLQNLISAIEESVGRKAKTRSLPMQQGDVFTTYADIEQAQKKLGYQPKTSLKEGIFRFVEWYQSHLLLAK